MVRALALLTVLVVACDGVADRPAPPAAGLSPPEPGAVVAPAGYRPPIAAPVVDGFRPPPTPFGAGNRGLEYDTEPGSPVGAIGAGRVVFAGPVAGSLHVTLGHPDGLRSSYSYLTALAVEPGDDVLAGEVVGTAGDRLHLGVRAGGAYLDPARLFGLGGVHLVPLR